MVVERIGTLRRYSCVLRSVWGLSNWLEMISPHHRGSDAMTHVCVRMPKHFSRACHIEKYALKS